MSHINIKNKVMEYNITPHKYPKETRKALRHTTMPVTKWRKGSTVIQNITQRQDTTWATALEKSLNKQKSSPSRLCSGVTISLMTMGISRICSHQ